jgi:hypothetical protein
MTVFQSSILNLPETVRQLLLTQSGGLAAGGRFTGGLEASLHGGFRAV